MSGDLITVAVFIAGQLSVLAAEWFRQWYSNRSQQKLMIIQRRIDAHRAFQDQLNISAIGIFTILENKIFESIEADYERLHYEAHEQRNIAFAPLFTSIRLASTKTRSDNIADAVNE